MKGIRWLLVAALLLLPAYSHALGLGRLKVHSALNEPLNAEVEFTSITEKEIKGLNASLATRADFDAAGIERQPYLSTIKFTVAKRLDGHYILQLQTEQPLDEPFVHFLLQIEWPGGRVIREYSALIDPPVQVTGKPPQVETPPAGDPARKEPVAAAEPEPTPEPPAAQPAPTVTAEPPAAAATTEPPTPAAEPAKPVAPEGAPPVAEKPAAADAPKPVAEAVKPDAEPAPAPPEVRTDKGPIMDGGSAPLPEPPPAAAATPSVEKLDAKPQPEAAAPAAADKPEPEPRPVAEQPSVPSTSPTWAGVAEYHVKPGDTMWAVADRVRTDKKIALEQVVLAIYRSNRAAFFGNNVNNLRAGKILKIPEREVVEGQPLAQARKEFRAQYDVWQEYKLKLASADRALKVPEEASRKPEAAAPATEETPKPAARKPDAKPQARPEAKPEVAKPETEKPPVQAEKKTDKPAVPAAGRAPQDELLRIVRANIKSDQQKGTPDKKVVETEAVKDRKERQSLAERVASLEESVISRQIHAKDLSDKIGAVRAQLKREKRLMELESQRLAEATRKPEPAAAPETKKPEVKAEDKPRPESTPEVKPAVKPEVQAETKPAAPVAPVKEDAKPVEVRKAAPPRRAAPPPEPAKEEKGFVAEMMDTVLGSDLMPVFLGGVVLVSGLIAVIYLRRRRRAIGEFEESILSADGSTDQPVMTTDTSGQAVPAGDTSFLSDFSQGGMGTTHTDEVDPVAEAEVYLAYGRDETAEEILKDAIVKNPERNELKVKLLEIYHQRNDARGFETLAEELYAALGGRGGKLWEKVEDMGRKLNPENPLFRGGAPAGGGKPAAKAGGARTMPGFNDTSRSMSSPGFTTPMGGDTGTVDFDKTGAGKASAPGSETSIDFDIGLGGPASGESMSEIARSAESAAPEAEPMGVGSPDTGLDDIDLSQAAPASGGSSIDFDMGASAPEPSAPVQSAAPADSGLDFDFGAAADLGADVAVAEQPAAGGEAGSAQWDETATKLDLAKAYIDMGDAEGARSILDEVMSEGNTSQKQQAKELAAQLG